MSTTWAVELAVASSPQAMMGCPSILVSDCPVSSVNKLVPACKLDSMLRLGGPSARAHLGGVLRQLALDLT